MIVAGWRRYWTRLLLWSQALATLGDVLVVDRDLLAEVGQGGRVHRGRDRR